MITQERLQEIFYCDTSEGVFYRRKNGKIAGAVNGAGYPQICVDYVMYLAHRLIWLYEHGSFPANQIDHINGNPADNRLENLRLSTQTENMKNRRVGKANTSKIMGVNFDTLRGKWLVRISVNGTSCNIGRFSDFFEACCVRKAAEITHGYHINHGRAK